MYQYWLTGCLSEDNSTWYNLTMCSLSVYCEFIVRGEIGVRGVEIQGGRVEIPTWKLEPHRDRVVVILICLVYLSTCNLIINTLHPLHWGHSVSTKLISGHLWPGTNRAPIYVIIVCTVTAILLHTGTENLINVLFSWWKNAHNLPNSGLWNLPV